jgi:hypothetical protein
MPSAWLAGLLGEISIGQIVALRPLLYLLAIETRVEEKDLLPCFDCQGRMSGPNSAVGQAHTYYNKHFDICC